MIRNTITFVVIAALMNFLIGCTTTRNVAVEKQEIPKLDEKIRELVLTDGTVIKFDYAGAMFDSVYTYGEHGKITNVVVGMTETGNISVTPVEKILEARVERTETSVGGSILLSLGVVVLIAGIILLVALATKQSCPFVYSYDGKNYTFDAEPLGGATTEGLRRTDYSRLEYLKPAEGEYRLMFRNEANETQYLDEVKLAVIDHAPDLSLASTYAGTFFSYSHPVQPLLVTDEHGRNVTSFFTAPDNVKWQTQVAADTLIQGVDLRHHLTFTFPKPKNATSVKLLVNAGTASWGSNMIREMLKLRGDKVDAWYRDIDRGGREVRNLQTFIDREELYILKVNVREGSKWTTREIIRGGGPLIDEDRLIDLDISHVTGDTLTIQLNPPHGFWKIDCLNLVEGATPISITKEIGITEARDQNGKDIKGLLSSSDSLYYSMPNVGDRATMSFAAISQPAGTSRSVYLKCAGYYTLHLPKDTPEQTALINELLSTPGKILEYSVSQYLKYRAQN
jgi:hypothetical protein